MRVGMFDSGLGGVNVLNEFIKIHPHNHYIYYGDTLNMPYGNKSIEDLFKIATNIIDFLIAQKVDIIIIACGTISSTCYSSLKKKYNIPIYDIISPTLDYISHSNYHNLGLIATTRTVNSNIFSNCSNIKLVKATPTFVPIIENNKIEEEQNEIIETIDVFKNKIDGLILGCTHYPSLSPILNSYLNVPLIDMGNILANSLKLTDSYLKLDLYFSKLDNNKIININNILGNNKYNLHSVKKID